MNTEFHSIDSSNWNRREPFYYFTKMLPTRYSLTVEIDITNTYNLLKKENKKFFPAYLYLTSKQIAEQQEFRMAEKEGRLGYYEVLHPTYACFHEHDNTISSMWTEYHSDFKIFYHNYIEDQKKYAGNHAIIAKPDGMPENICSIGMLPWIQFTNYTPMTNGNENSLFPVLQAGKFFNRDHKKMMPLSITVHHAVADGYHVGVFLNKLQDNMSNPEAWIY